jgi:hypothetical protein
MYYLCFVNLKYMEHITTDLLLPPTLIEMLDALSRTTSQSAYVIDYVNERVLFGKGAILLPCYKTRCDEFLQNMPRNEKKRIEALTAARAQFLKRQPKGERIQYTFRCNFCPSANMRIRHSWTPWQCNTEGECLYAIVTDKLASDTVPYATMISRGESSFFSYNPKTAGAWDQCDAPILTKKEQLILLLADGNCGIAQTAAFMGISEDSVKAYRKIILEKFEIKGMHIKLATSLGFRMGII